jgi:hypothetical protein
MLSSIRFWGLKVQKRFPFSPPFLHHDTFDRAEIFSTGTRHCLGCVFFPVPSNLLPSTKKIRNTETTLKKSKFSPTANFVKSAKNQQSDIIRNESKDAPETMSSTCRKKFSSMQRTMTEKRGRFYRIFRKKKILKETKKKD